jgi:branched-chain amino acid transport system ATP-binding protein
VPLLELRNITRRFGGVVALDDVSLDVEDGEIAGLIGPNGAGKTTAFNVITRLYKPDAGEVVFAGESLLRTPAHKVVRRGIARTFQNVELFPSMTVLDNVLVGAQARTGLFKERRARRAAQDALEYVALEGLAGRPGAGLPHGAL